MFATKRGKLSRYRTIMLISSVLTILIVGGPTMMTWLLPGFHPHTHGMLSNPTLIWRFMLSDSLTGIAYLAISSMLVYLVYTARDTIPFQGIFLAFGLFIIACGMTHLMHVWTLWRPDYGLEGTVKAFTAIVSIATAFALPPLLPNILALIERAKLADKHQLDLEVVNAKLIYALGDRMRAEAAVRDSEERFRQAFDCAAIGMALVALDGTFLRVNQALCEIVGYGEQELLTMTFQAITHPDDLETDLDQAKQLLAGTIGYYHMEKRYLHKHGQIRWVLLSGTLVRDAQGNPLHFIAQIQDITQRKATEAHLQQHAFYDTLTGLPNRALFIDRLTQALLQVQRSPERLFAVLFLDLDRFKNINDSLGHLVGDTLLEAVAQRLDECVRVDDTAARFGGDEFALLLNNLTHIDDAMHVAERIQARLALPFVLGDEVIFTSASIGITASTMGYTQAPEMLRDADTALYHAKALGKARYALFDTAMHARTMALMELEAALRRALEREEFCLHYQPVVSVPTGQIVGLEALVRWQHPQRGLISPVELIPLAEETGLIVPLGQWVLRTACTQAKAWQSSGLPPLPVAVNLSARQVKQKELSTMVVQVLDETDLDAQWLVLELTESSLMDHTEATIGTLEALTRLGVRFSIDDFGTGYSSLSYLKRFPISTLKVAQAFIRDILTDANDAAITKSIISMAQSLNLQVIAEGVERHDQLAFLQAQGCDLVQGYVFSRPVPADEVSWLMQRPLGRDLVDCATATS